MDPAKIILIEDQLIPAYDMRRQLNDLGYSVVGVFTHAEEGLAYLEQSNGTQHFPEVVITDIYLAGKVTGLEASRIINAKYDCAVIISTGLFNRKIIEEGLKNRPAFFLLKPFDIFHTHICIQMAFYQRKLEKENKLLKEELERLKQ